MATIKYNDIDLSFTKHPVSKDLLKLSNDEAIKNSIKNLLLTFYFEHPFRPELGSGIRDQLFENWTGTSAGIIEKNIIFIINNFEPRVELLGIQISDNVNDYNTMKLEIFYLIKATSASGVVSVILNRSR